MQNPLGYSLYEDLMKYALSLAENGNGKVSPNPMVGALLVLNNQVVTEGWHQEFGGPHAEVMAINKWKGSFEGVTLFTTLEPCCHNNKKTPPCTDLIIKSGIKKVVISAFDPNPNVSGKGVEVLKRAGIEVTIQVSDEIEHNLNRAFRVNQIYGRPYYHVKVSQTLNGMLSNEIGKATSISNAEVQSLVHKMRFESDAVMIGKGTLNIDNPLLTIRHHPCGLTKKLYKIIVGNPNDMNLDSRIFHATENSGMIVLLVNSEIKITSILSELFEARKVTIMRYEKSFQECNSDLLKLGIGKILIEPGVSFYQRIIDEKLYDQLTVFLTPKYFNAGAQVATNASISFEKSDMKMVGDNIMINYYLGATTCSQG